MSDDRKEYTVDIGGIPHTLLLNADEATARGAVEAKRAPKPANKAHKPQNKQG